MKVHLRIPALELPKKLPRMAAIKSFGSNIHSYEPDFWEFQYETYRYLGGMQADQLASRYQEIVRNFRVFARPESHEVPIECLFGSWYWYRKEHQTRYEFFRRKLKPPCDPPTEVVNISAASTAFPERYPDGHLIFRYGELRWMRGFLEGSVRITAADEYYAMETDGARLDDELNKHAFIPAEYSQVTAAGGQDIRLRSDIRRTASAPNYYALCASCEWWGPDLFQEFKAEACVVIREPGIFINRLRSATATELIGWYFHDGPVQYFDPYEWKNNEPFHATNSKDFKFAHQREYRFLWDPLGLSVSAVGHRMVNVGSMNDIAELYDASGVRLA